MMIGFHLHELGNAYFVGLSFNLYAKRTLAFKYGRIDDRRPRVRPAVHHLIPIRYTSNFE